MTDYTGHTPVVLGRRGKLHLTTDQRRTLCGRKIDGTFPAHPRATTCAACRDRWREGEGTRTPMVAPPPRRKKRKLPRSEPVVRGGKLVALRGSRPKRRHVSGGDRRNGRVGSKRGRDR